VKKVSSEVERIAGRQGSDVASAKGDNAVGSPKSVRSSTARLLQICVAFVLALHTAMLAWEAGRAAPTVDEVAYLAAGLSHWQFGRFDLANVSPPLVRLVAAIPVIAAKPQYDWHTYESQSGARVAHQVGREFMAANGQRSFWLFTLGRFACIPFSLFGAFVCFRWARELYGEAPGLLALCLWCFSPAILGNGQFLSPDVGVSALGVGAGYTFWRWFKTPSWPLTMVAGSMLGLAELAKTNMIVLFLLWPALWAIFRVANRGTLQHKTATIQRLSIVLLVGLYVVNLGYGFEASFQELRSFAFHSQLLSGTDHGGNRFATCLLGHLPVPIPANYLLGMDTQRTDFENLHGERKSYLRGLWHEHGWWWFYFYVMAVKGPLGTWGLFVLATVVRCQRSFRMDPKRLPARESDINRCARNLAWEDDLTLLAPASCLLLLASSQTGFSHHSRYLLPALPFAWIWISQTAATLVDDDLQRGWKKRLLPCGVCFMATWSIVSSLWIWPHSLAYFNEIAGGPCKGDFHLQESNIDWGEDLLYLRRWINKNPGAQPLHVAYWGIVDPKLAGINCEVPDESLKDGWYAISVKCLRGDGRFGPNCESFLAATPIDRIGYSIRVYHIRQRDELPKPKTTLEESRLPAQP
jgi:Dolichyl-phosphate-mannose-protein mannosyltransferase